MSFSTLAIAALPLGVVAFVLELFAVLVFIGRRVIPWWVPRLPVTLLYLTIPTVTFWLGVAYLALPDGEARSNVGWALLFAVPLTVFDALWDFFKIQRLEKPRKEEMRRWAVEHKVRPLTKQELADMRAGKPLAPRL